MAKQVSASRRRKLVSAPRQKPTRNYFNELLPFIDQNPTPKLRSNAPQATSVDAASILIGDQAIDRIITSVGKNFVPAILDKSALCAALDEAQATQEQIAKFRPGSGISTKLKQLARIGEAADALLSLLAADNHSTELIADYMSEAMGSVRKLRIVIDVIEVTLDENTKGLAARYPRRIPTANEWLVGVELPCIYEEFFRRPAAVSRNGGKPGGPMIRFIKAVLAEINKSYADESIVRAITGLAKLRDRRRLVRGALGTNCA